MVVYWLRFLLDLEKNPAQTGTSLRKYCGGTIFTWKGMVILFSTNFFEAGYQQLVGGGFSSKSNIWGPCWSKKASAHRRKNYGPSWVSSILHFFFQLFWIQKSLHIEKWSSFFISVHSFSKYFLSFFEKHYSILACELYTRKIEGGGSRQIVELLLNIFT